MSRPIKTRIICRKPEIDTFGPSNKDNDLYIYMNLEEYETIRLMDHEGLTQEECASFMNVARTTIQRIYEEARKKMADAIVNGKTIKIEGGNYTLCNKMKIGKRCNRVNCPRFVNKI